MGKLRIKITALSSGTMMSHVILESIVIGPFQLCWIKRLSQTSDWMSLEEKGKRDFSCPKIFSFS